MGSANRIVSGCSIATARGQHVSSGWCYYIATIGRIGYASGITNRRSGGSPFPLVDSIAVPHGIHRGFFKGDRVSLVTSIAAPGATSAHHGGAISIIGLLKIVIVGEGRQVYGSLKLEAPRRVQTDARQARSVSSPGVTRTMSSGSVSRTISSPGPSGDTKDE